jgi:hypothetical protein
MRLLLSLVLLASLCLAADVRLGKPFALKEPVSVAAVMEKPDAWVGKTVQVKGKVAEVCQMMGCWMNLSDTATGKSIRIKVNDGDIVFPKDAPGRMAIAEGTLAKMELTREQAVAQAKHEAEETGRKFDPKSVKGPFTTYQIQGTGAVILSE